MLPHRHWFKVRHLAAGAWTLCAILTPRHAYTGEATAGIQPSTPFRDVVGSFFLPMGASPSVTTTPASRPSPADPPLPLPSDILSPASNVRDMGIGQPYETLDAVSQFLSTVTPPNAYARARAASAADAPLPPGPQLPSQGHESTAQPPDTSAAQPVPPPASYSGCEHPQRCASSGTDKPARKSKDPGPGKRTVAQAREAASIRSRSVNCDPPLNFPQGPFDCTLDVLFNTINKYTNTPSCPLGGGFKVKPNRREPTNVQEDAVVRQSYRCKHKACAWEVTYERTTEGWTLVRYMPHRDVMEVTSASGDLGRRTHFNETHHATEHQLDRTFAEVAAQSAGRSDVPKELEAEAERMAESGLPPKYVAQYMHTQALWTCRAAGITHGYIAGSSSNIRRLPGLTCPTCSQRCSNVKTRKA